jgi:hypothetical protein
VAHDPAAGGQLAQAASAVGSSHAEIVGDGHEQRADVEIAGPSECVDLEHRPAWMAAFHDVAVIDDPLEHRKRPDPHDAGNTDSMGELDDAARVLADAIERALPGWVVRSVVRIHDAWQGSTPMEVMDEADRAGRRAAHDVGSKVHELLLLDASEQWTTPLSLVREAVVYPTEVLRAAGVPEVVRDAYDEAAFPDDVYGLTPASLGDLDPALTEAGVVWGVAKAAVYRRRRDYRG